MFLFCGKRFARNKQDGLSKNDGSKNDILKYL